MNHDVHSTVVIFITKLMLQLTMYQTVILTCPDNCQRKGSKNRTNFSNFPQKPAGSPSLCSSPFCPASHFTCFYFLVVTCFHFSLVTCFRSCRAARCFARFRASRCSACSLLRALAIALAARRFAPAAASLRSGTPLRGFPSHSLRSRAPPAHGAAGGYAVRRLAAIRLSRRETCSDIVTQQDPLYWCRCLCTGAGAKERARPAPCLELCQEMQACYDLFFFFLLFDLNLSA